MFVTRNLALINLIVQFLLIAAVAFSAYLPVKKRVQRHCLVTNIATGALIVSIGGIMLPAMLPYITSGVRGFFFNWIAIHHTLGLAVIALVVYFNLRQRRIIKIKGRMRTSMRWALGIWVVSLLAGIYIFITLWF